MIKMLKTLGKSVREYKKPALVTPLLVTLEVIMEVVIPLLMAELIDKGIYAGQMSEVLKFGVILIISSILSLAFGVLSGITASKASAGFAKNLRKDLYYKIQDFSFKSTVFTAGCFSFNVSLQLAPPAATITFLA